MTKQEALEIIEAQIERLPDRMSGAQEDPILLPRLKGLVQTERSAVVQVLRDWIGLRIPQRERQPGDGLRVYRMWLALKMVQTFGIRELSQDIEALLGAIQRGDTFLPYYEEMIRKYLPSAIE